MGYKPGQALGRSGVGITEPISESAQLGRRGLGFTAGGLEREDVKWEEEEVRNLSPFSLASPPVHFLFPLLKLSY